MRLSIETLFPDVPRFVEINLNDWLRTHCDTRPEGAEAYQKAIDRLHAEVGAPTYGGWMEQREWMWSGSYMDADENYTHLGIDVYLHRNTTIQLPFATRVINSFYNEDDEVGWGGRITLQRNEESPAIILGHLEPELPAVGTHLAAGEVIGRLATWPRNGNVFEHLHIQLVATQSIPEINWQELDGYGFPSDAKRYPHPFRTEI